MNKSLESSEKFRTDLKIQLTGVEGLTINPNAGRDALRTAL